MEEDAALRRRLDRLLCAHDVVVAPNDSAALPSPPPDLVIVGSWPPGASACLATAHPIRHCHPTVPSSSSPTTAPNSSPSPPPRRRSRLLRPSRPLRRARRQHPTLP